ncbi:MAG: tetratricopeptide repeat protein, partial [Turneriella sp.]|nr:tetratricopeptide repeat protein [Turneriella sp.]
MADVQEQGRARSKLAILFEQARAAEDKGDLRTALDRYKMILQIDQKFFEAWLNAGAIYTRQGKSDKAITCYQRALASKNDVRAHYNLAVEYYKKEDYAAAEKSLRSALKLEPRNLKAHLLLGYVFGKTGRNDKAEIAIRNALKIEPDNKAAQTALALLYFHTGRTELALRQIKLLRAKNPKDPLLATLEAKLALASNDLASAATNFKEVAAQDPQLAEFYKT